MFSVKKPQMLFVTALFSVLMVFQGKATFRNLSRYCGMHEKRFSRWSRSHFDFALFNTTLIKHEFHENVERIAAIDASFMKKVANTKRGWVGFTTVNLAKR